jgi:HEPN domain-containing protein
MGGEGEARKWLAFAEEDLEYGRFGLARFPRAAAWSFQQAAEKALKACLIATGSIPPRTHDLVLLHNLTGAKNEFTIGEAVLKLAEVSTSSRYPDDTETISVELAKEYEQAASAIVLWANKQAR